MRAILIDPEKRTITEIQLEDDDYEKFRRRFAAAASPPERT